MKNILTALLIAACASNAQAQWGFGGWGSATPDTKGIIEKGTFTLTGPWTFSKTLEINGETQVSTLTLSGGGIQLDTTLDIPPHSEGLLFYDNVDKTLAYHSFLVGVTAQIPEENWVRFFNNTGSTILNGKAVYLTTSTTPGGIPHGELAKADTEVTARAAGLATIDVPSLSTGIITSFGDVRDFNTGAVALGSIFLSATVAGDFTNTKPIPPNFETQMGHLTIVGVSSGRVHLMVGPPTLGGAANAAILGSTQVFTGSNAFANPVTIVGSSLTVTGDLGVDSPTLFVDSTANKVGIGTVIPDAALDVNGDAQFGSGATKSTFTAAGNLQTVSGFTISGGTVSFQGRVAIGNGSPTTDTAINLHVNGGDLLIDNDRAIRWIDNAGAVRKAMTVESTDDLTIGSSSFDDVIIKVGTLSEALRIKQVTGNVGIGTTNPSSILHIKANTPGTVGDSPALQFIIQHPSTDVNLANAGITLYSSDASGKPDKQLAYFGSSSGSNQNITLLNRRNATLTLGTNGLTRLTVDSNGDVGIGIASPGAKLDISGNIKIADGTQDPGKVLTSDAAGLATWSTVATAGLAAGAVTTTKLGDAAVISIKLASDFTSLDRVTGGGMTALSGGNVGIGTTNPDGKLHVESGSAGLVITSADQLVAESDGETVASIVSPDINNGTLFFRSPGDVTGGLVRWNFSQSLMSVGTGKPGASLRLTSDDFQERLRIDSIGNVGIGTTNPGSLLEVDGEMRAGQRTSADCCSDTPQRAGEFCYDTGLSDMFFSTGAVANQYKQVIGTANCG